MSLGSLTATIHPFRTNWTLAGRRRIQAAGRWAAILLISFNVVIAANGIVPSYMAAQSAAISASASRHAVPSAWLSAVLYNEMMGTEDQVLTHVIPGDSAAAQHVRQTVLGLHFITLKQAQWQIKTALALFGSDVTVGAAGIRVSVGRQLRSETELAGGAYVASGWMERPSMILDLAAPATAIEYLAANLERGQALLAAEDRGDWSASARWHNTGVVYDSAIVRPEDWDKGSRYIERVQSYLPYFERPSDSSGETDLERTARPPRLGATGETASAKSQLRLP